MKNEFSQKNIPLSEYITSHLEMNAEILTETLNKQQRKEVEKGTLLLQPGEVCRHSIYVEQGLLKYYAIDSKGKEHILQFAPEGWFVGDRESTFNHSASRYYIEAIEKSVVVFMDPYFFDQFSEQVKGLSAYNIRLLQKHICHLQNRIHQLLASTAEERYLEFIKLYPDILLRVPQTMVASYLGITPESLSRVRKELAQKNFRP